MVLVDPRIVVEKCRCLFEIEVDFRFMAACFATSYGVQSPCTSIVSYLLVCEHPSIAEMRV